MHGCIEPQITWKLTEDADPEGTHPQQAGFKLPMTKEGHCSRQSQISPRSNEMADRLESYVMGLSNW